MGAALPLAKTIARSTATALLWGMAMTISAAASLLLRGRLETFHLPTILTIFFAGGFLAWLLTELVGWSVISLARRRSRRQWPRAVLAGTGLAAATLFVTAALFALEYRSFYARWHAETLSRVWLLQFAFTSASAYYQFAVMALRLYLPLGPFFLVAGTWIMLRRMR
ncbi:hypothetical protein ACQKKX_10075 [Neorhizobium sp. NPDC001467]|uniref:hypothetical protein n=1 Tax=Neorhizobium sp. NPDC001467 TaxID=3390595 RepID=UPI003D0835E6